ncbi:30S ribosomal protein S7 [bacterium HR21]|jgi:small subunit ribosomal protein S7|uniref:Small ribosomal subunit protein uS7 n=1 Tax=uncultured Chlorobiota bacterium TaxID=156405 RepID=H5SGQ8_9BACT|nr:30S ribosomal protein S7 [uncultured Chlorobiota bacterium]GBD06722.1 30S ribosomal protein S7 [bacterium HR21]
MRRRRAEKRHIDPDPRYGDVMVAKFINVIMRDGKKSIARRIVYEAFDIIRERTKKDPLETFHKAITNVAPVVEVRSRRIGGANYQIPMEVREDRRIALAMRWIKQYARERRDKSMALKLAAELIAAANGEGGAIRKRDEVHRMAEANRAFAHYRW